MFVAKDDARCSSAAVKRIVGLILRACGLVALVIGAYFLLNWFGAEILPRLLGHTPRNSFPFQLVRDIGFALTVLGIAFRILAARLLKEKDTPRQWTIGVTICLGGFAALHLLAAVFHQLSRVS